MQQRTSRLAMRKHRHAAHDRLDRVRVDNALFDTGDEERRLATAKVVI
jgi:hypothetical protein